MRSFTVLTLAAVLAMAGCIQNMSDLKDNVAGGDDDLQPAAVVTPSTTLPEVKNETVKPKQPPVARITIFGSNGALVFKSTFKADDQTEMVMVENGAKLSLIAGDSEALEPGATLTGFAWSLDGKPVEGARQASLELKDAGLYTLMLVVTDSNGKTDSQSVSIGVPPEPFEEVIELVSGAVVGAGFDAPGDPVDTPFELAAPADKPAKVTALRVVASPPALCDIALDVIGPGGDSVGSADDASTNAVDGTETVETGEVPLGAFTARLSPWSCVAQDGIPITVTVTYLPIVEGFDGVDHGGHGGHGGH